MTDLQRLLFLSVDPLTLLTNSCVNVFYRAADNWQFSMDPLASEKTATDRTRQKYFDFDICPE
jgi:hypothetical protein